MSEPIAFDLRVIARFEAKLAEGPGGCWLWMSNKNHRGYGQFTVRAGWNSTAHRWSYRLHIGEVPEGLELDHLCRVRHCVNPWHLDPVPHIVNVERGEQAQRAHCPKGHPYDEGNTYVRPIGNGKRRGRHCKECQRDAVRRYRARRAEPKDGVRDGQSSDA